MEALDYVKAKAQEVEETDLLELLRNAKVIYRAPGGKGRWWQDEFVVVNLGGRLIAYWDATTTGDENAEEKGWKFDPDSIGDAEAYEHTETRYRFKEGAA